jgi:glucose/arabinose dehydrogenase
VTDNEISGIAFAPDGKLMVASTQGVIYRVDTAA